MIDQLQFFFPRNLFRVFYCSDMNEQLLNLKKMLHCWIITILRSVNFLLLIVKENSNGGEAVQQN